MPFDDHRETLIAPRDPLLNRVIADKIELLEQCGRGGMGTVYRGVHRFLNKAVAVKVMNRWSSEDPEQEARFQREAMATSRLDHPHAVQILDFGVESDGLHYIVMEYVEAESLSWILQRGPVPARRALNLMSQVLSALGAAHENGVIHRDIKPGNILVLARRTESGAIEDFVKVCDFGLARVLAGGDLRASSIKKLTLPGAALGTPEYMSPQQAMGDEIDARADLYSCGVVLYRMLTGVLPFTGASDAVIMQMHIDEKPAPLRRHQPQIAPELEALVEKALEKELAFRWKSAQEMRAEMLRLLDAAPSVGMATLIDQPRSAFVAPRPPPEVIAVPEPARAKVTRVLDAVPAVPFDARETVRDTKPLAPAVRDTIKVARSTEPSRWPIWVVAFLLALLVGMGMLAAFR